LDYQSKEQDYIERIETLGKVELNLEEERRIRAQLEKETASLMEEVSSLSKEIRALKEEQSSKHVALDDSLTKYQDMERLYKEVLSVNDNLEKRFLELRQENNDLKTNAKKFEEFASLKPEIEQLKARNELLMKDISSRENRRLAEENKQNEFILSMQMQLGELEGKYSASKEEAKKLQLMNSQLEFQLNSSLEDNEELLNQIDSTNSKAMQDEIKQKETVVQICFLKLGNSSTQGRE
jgi:chromosome segregation ATPase